ncbi:hypothetical protein SAMN06265349_101688 [Flavobacterium resistens]|uniref:Uncharacterized protein n=1 Tax=Flavobacterium resistens TaxID=443612 RepID=A0A521B521_9FLAO|nr:hypothetical protein [Flavobacterium resistens]MRX70307.1 hypothetical protein [Flavobacterium resistens]SMO42179.1 hypothetical protein SAMN06265349_101688 [Flavobacterium resistens]
MNEKQYHTLINNIKDIETPFYQDWSFWISTIIGIIGIYFSIVAYREAKEAKKAAKAAGNIVKIQSITIDLTEITQRLDKISIDLTYSDARDFYSEINRRLRRITSVLTVEPSYTQKTSEILLTLAALKNNLDEVRQVGQNNTTADGINIFYAIEGEFSNLSGHLADLAGLLEQRTL